MNRYTHRRTLADRPRVVLTPQNGLPSESALAPQHTHLNFYNEVSVFICTVQVLRMHSCGSFITASLVLGAPVAVLGLTSKDSVGGWEQVGAS